MKKVVGGILLAIGILIAGASGLCTLVLLPSMLNGGMESVATGLAAAGLFGGIPFATGTGIGILGWALIQSAKREEGD